MIRRWRAKRRRVGWGVRERVVEGCRGVGKGGGR